VRLYRQRPAVILLCQSPLFRLAITLYTRPRVSIHYIEVVSRMPSASIVQVDSNLGSVVCQEGFRAILIGENLSPENVEANVPCGTLLGFWSF